MTEEQPTIIPPGEAALVTVDGMCGWELLLPDPHGGLIDPKANVPVAVRMLTACCMRAEEQEWVDEMLRWLNEKMGGELEEAKPAGNA